MTPSPTAETTRGQARSAGYRAAMLGALESANPYKGEEMRAAWLAGWREFERPASLKEKGKANEFSST